VREALESSTRARAGERATSPIERLFEQHREEIRQIAARHHGRAIYIFGSVARGDARPGSDLDFLVDFEPGSSLFDLMRITDELEELLGCRVDVVSRGGLKGRDTHILEEARQV
jgi:predicted nucleotidyltransferase